MAEQETRDHADVRRSAVLAMQPDSARRFEGDITVGEAAARALVSLGCNIGRLPLWS